jgi:GTP cyclohydrolase I
MCAVCRKIEEGILTPQKVEELLEEVQHKISNEHLEEVEEKVAEYFDTFNYGPDEEMLEDFDDDLNSDERRMITEYGNEEYDMDDLVDMFDDYEG